MSYQSESPPLRSRLRRVRKRDAVAFVVGGYVGKKLVVGALKKVLPK